MPAPPLVPNPQPGVNEAMKTKVAVQDLRFGMYVYQLDRPWTETPFAFQGFLLNSEEQRKTLKQYCQHVFVDSERSEEDPNRSGAAVRGSLGAPSGVRRIEHVEHVSVENEFPRAREAFAGAESVVEGAFQTLRAGSTLNVTATAQVVSRMTESVLRNPDAMLLFSSLMKRGGHLLDRAVNCSIYMLTFARFLGMERADVERAGNVGMLQDVGMLEMPESLIAKNGPLSSDEIELVRTHVLRGVERLRRANISADITDIVVQHHERHNGSGYPHRLKGPEISTIGACAGIVDTFGAMTKHRPYANEMSPSNVLGILHKWRDGLFNGWLVEEFIRCIGIFPVGSVVELNTGEVGIVISQNIAKRLQPRVMVIKDAKGQPLRPQKLLDLSRPSNATAEESTRIRRTLEYSRAGVSAQEMFL